MMRGVVLRLLQEWLGDAPDLARTDARRQAIAKIVAIYEPVWLRITADDRRGNEISHRTFSFTAWNMPPASIVSSRRRAVSCRKPSYHPQWRGFREQAGCEGRGYMVAYFAAPLSSLFHRPGHTLATEWGDLDGEHPHGMHPHADTSSTRASSRNCAGKSP